LKPRLALLAVLAGGTFLAGILLPGTIQAQALYVPTAPKPLQLSIAKTVFISNNTCAPLADSDRVYDEIYSSIQQLHRFSILTAPDGADLVLEFSLSTSADNVQQVTLRVIDGKTRAVLWSVSDSGETKAIYGTHGKKNQHDVIDTIVDYLAIVTAPVAQHN